MEVPPETIPLPLEEEDKETEEVKTIEKETGMKDEDDEKPSHEQYMVDAFKHYMEKLPQLHLKNVHRGDGKATTQTFVGKGEPIASELALFFTDGRSASEEEAVIDFALTYFHSKFKMLNSPSMKGRLEPPALDDMIQALRPKMDPRKFNEEKVKDVLCGLNCYALHEYDLFTHTYLNSGFFTFLASFPKSCQYNCVIYVIDKVFVVTKMCVQDGGVGGEPRHSAGRNLERPVRVLPAAVPRQAAEMVRWQCVHVPKVRED